MQPGPCYKHLSNSPSFQLTTTNNQRLVFAVTLVLLLLSGLRPIVLMAQIWEPEGLNLPGAWNGWTNPPANNLALASATQVIGGQVVKITTGTTRWQTIFSVAASGGDIVGGSYNWLFTSGPSNSPFNNKWAGVTVNLNILQSYSFNSGADNSITIANGKWYTMNWEDIGYTNNRAIFMETSAEPVTLSSVSTTAEVAENENVTITLITSDNPSPEEMFYLRYSTDAWTTSELISFNMVGDEGTAEIPGQIEGTVVSYYAFSSTIAGISTDFDLKTINLNNNGGINYTFTVSAVTPMISFANLQWPENGNIEPGEDFNVYAQVYAENVTDAVGQGAGVQ